MDGARRGRTPPLEVRREFTGSRLEVQLLAQTYELIVPVIRRSALTARTSRDLVDGQAVRNPTRPMGQGA
jgi:hypothetical protein